MKPERKFRRRTLRQWAAFVRKGQRRKTYGGDRYLHDFEDEVILRKWLETGRSTVTAKELAGLCPDLFNPRLLPRAMKRMARAGTIERAGRSAFGGNNQFKLKEHGAHRAQAA